MIEIIVSIGILLLIASIGLFISMDFLRGGSAHSEQDVVVSLLQNARSESINNINQARHGVHFQSSPLRYTEFECKPTPPNPTCVDYASGADMAKDLLVNSSFNVSITAPALPFDIIFNQLNGDCISCTSPVNIKINDGVQDYMININSEGQIDW